MNKSKVEEEEEGDVKIEIRKVVAQNVEENLLKKFTRKREMFAMFVVEDLKKNSKSVHEMWMSFYKA